MKKNKFLLKRIKEMIFNVTKIDNVTLRIIGDGELKDYVKKQVELFPSKIEYLGALSNDDIFKEISESDLLLLVSKKDGWGATINESLLVGTPVLATSTCGAGVLLDNDYRGEQFYWNNNLREKITKWIEKDDLGKLNQEGHLIRCIGWQKSL